MLFYGPQCTKVLRHYIKLLTQKNRLTANIVTLCAACVFLIVKYYNN